MLYHKKKHELKILCSNYFPFKAAQFMFELRKQKAIFVTKKIEINHNQ